MKKSLIRIVAFLGILATIDVAAATSVYWKNDVPPYRAEFLSASNWNTPTDFATGTDYFRVESRQPVGSTNTVVLTSGCFMGALSLCPWENGVIVFDGAGADFALKSADGISAANAAGQPAFVIRDNDYSLANVSMADTNSVEIFRWTNALFSVGRVHAVKRMDWNIDRGYFCFAEPGAANTARNFVTAGSSAGDSLFAWTIREGCGSDTSRLRASGLCDQLADHGRRRLAHGQRRIQI